MLEKAQKEYHFLTYLCPEHLWVLRGFFFGERGQEEVGDIMNFINPNYEMQSPSKYANSEMELYEILCLIGEYLDKVP